MRGGIPKEQPQCVCALYLALNAKVRRFAVEGIGFVRILQKLWKENLEDIYKVVHWAPSLIDDVEANGAGGYITHKKDKNVSKTRFE